MSNRLVNIIGIITLISSISYLLKKINRETETSLISDKAFDVLSDKDRIEKLNSAVSNYHNNGVWDKDELESVM